MGLRKLLQSKFCRISVVVFTGIAVALFGAAGPARASSIGQMKNSYNGLCMDAGNQKAYTLIKFQKCNTKSPSQYFSGTAQLGGIQLDTLNNHCVTVKGWGGDPIPALALEVGNCKGGALSQVFWNSGGGGGVPIYLSSDKPNFKPSDACVGDATKSVGALVLLSTCARGSYQGWSGPIIIIG